MYQSSHVYTESAEYTKPFVTQATSMIILLLFTFKANKNYYVIDFGNKTFTFFTDSHMLSRNTYYLRLNPIFPQLAIFSLILRNLLISFLRILLNSMKVGCNRLTARGRNHLISAIVEADTFVIVYFSLIIINSSC